MKRPEIASFGWFMAACFLSSNYDGPTGCTKWVRPMNPGAGLEMWYKSTAWPPQHSSLLNVRRFGVEGFEVGSVRVNLSQCKVILLWLPGACIWAQTHKQFYQIAHGVLGKGICSCFFFITDFLSSGMWTTDLLSFTNRRKPPAAQGLNACCKSCTKIQY